MSNKDKTNTWDDVPRTTSLCGICSREYREGDKSSLTTLICEDCLYAYYPEIYSQIRQ